MFLSSAKLLRQVVYESLAEALARVRDAQVARAGHAQSRISAGIDASRMERGRCPRSNSSRGNCSRYGSEDLMPRS